MKMPKTKMCWYDESGNLLKVAISWNDYKADCEKRVEYTPEEYILHLEKQIGMLEKAFEDGGRITYIHTY
jgi:glycerol kinase